MSPKMYKSPSPSRDESESESRWPEPLSGRATPAHLRVGRVATCRWSINHLVILFYEILIQRDECSSDKNSLFMRR